MSLRLTERQLMKKLAQEEAEKEKVEAAQDPSKGGVQIAEKGPSTKRLPLEERKRRARAEAKSRIKKTVQSDDESEAEFEGSPKLKQEGDPKMKMKEEDLDDDSGAMSALQRFQRPARERQARKRQLVLEDSDEEEPKEKMKIKKKPKKESNEDNKSIQRRTTPPSDPSSTPTELSKSMKHEPTATGSGSIPKPSSLIASMIPSGSSSTTPAPGQPMSSLITNMMPAPSTGFSVTKSSSWRGDSSGNRRRPNSNRAPNRPQTDKVKSEPSTVTPVLIESIPPPADSGRSQTQILSETPSSKPAEYKPSDTERKALKRLQDALSDIVSQEKFKLDNEHGPLDPSGSFIRDEESEYDFFDTNEKGEIVEQPTIPIFPEEFPPGMTERPLSWWGIVDPEIHPDDKPEHLRQYEEWKADLHKGKATPQLDTAPSKENYGTNEQLAQPKKEPSMDARHKEQSSNWERKDLDRPQYPQHGPPQEGRPPQGGNWDRDRNQRANYFQNGGTRDLSRPPQANAWDRREEERPPYPQGPPRDSRHSHSDKWDRDRPPFPQRGPPGPGQPAPQVNRGFNGRGGRNTWEERRGTFNAGRNERIPR